MKLIEMLRTHSWKISKKQSGPRYFSNWRYRACICDKCGISLQIGYPPKDSVIKRPIWDMFTPEHLYSININSALPLEYEKLVCQRFAMYQALK